MTKLAWLFCIMCGVWLCASGAGIGQPAKAASPISEGKAVSSPKGTARVIISLTREQKARMDKAYYLAMAAWTAIGAENYEDAEVKARQSIELGDFAFLSQAALAASLNGQGKVQEALQAYKVMVDAGDEDNDELLPYSLLLLKTGQWAQAVAVFNKALPAMGDGDIIGGDDIVRNAYSHFSPAMPQPRELETALHVALGMHYDGYFGWSKQPQDGKSLAEYHQAFLLSPNSPVTNLFEGRRLQKMHQFAQANAAFVRAAALGGPNIKATVAEALR